MRSVLVWLGCVVALLACAADRETADAAVADAAVADAAVGDATAADSGAVLSCVDASLEFARAWQLWTDPRSCESDDDCTLREPMATCAASQSDIRDCPLVIHVDSASDFDAWQQGAASDLCPVVPAACTSIPDCALTRAICSGTCIPEHGAP